MTLVGKIFTVLVFVMSIVFMSFSVMVFATHKNWKEAALSTEPAKGTGEIGLKPRLDQAYRRIQGLQLELEQARFELAEEQTARRQALATLQVKVQQAADELQSAQDQLSKLQAAHSEAVTNLGVAQAALDKATTEATTLRDDLVSIAQDRDEKLLRVQGLTDQVNQAQGTLALLAERRDQLLSQVAEQKRVMDLHGLTVTTPVDHIAPVVDGVVTAVSDKNLIEISIGRDDGLKVGHQLEVFRSNQYLGRIVVRQTSPNRAVAEIIKEYQKGPIRKGDRVATKIT